MNDQEARELCEEFRGAIEIAVRTFLAGHQVPWVGEGECVAICQERLCVYGGLMPTMNPTGKDADWGKLGEWRRGAGSTEACVKFRLMRDLRDAVLQCPKARWQPMGARVWGYGAVKIWWESLDELMDAEREMSQQ